MKLPMCASHPSTFMEELKSLLGESEENKDDSTENPKAD